MSGARYPLRTLGVGAVLGALLTAATVRADLPASREVPLAELLAHAARAAPKARLAELRRMDAEVARAQAGPWLRSNPTLEAGAGPRYVGRGARDYDFFVTLEQPIEVAGQRGLRQRAAERLGAQRDAEAVAARWELRRDVTLAYHAAVLAKEHMRVARGFVGFAEELLALARRRLEAGDATAIDVRLAQADLARARQDELAAVRDLLVARLELAELTGWSIDAPPDVPAGLGPVQPLPALSAVQASALARHPELAARRAESAEVAAEVELAEREAWPTPVLGVQVVREGAVTSPPNYSVLGTVGVPLPLWQRNHGERARRRAEARRAEVEQAVAANALRAEVARAHAELSAARARVELYRQSVAPELESSLDLLRRGLTAGELSFGEVAAARERLLGAERDALGAWADYHAALAALEHASGVESPAREPGVLQGAR